MKTKIRTFITVGIVAFAGINANATMNYSNLKNSVVVEEEKNGKSLKAYENITELNGKITKVLNEVSENANDVLDLQKEAQLVTRMIADREEAKTVEMMMSKNARFYDPDAEYENANERVEAQLVTKMIADNEEAKAFQKLIAEGKFSESK